MRQTLIYLAHSHSDHSGSLNRKCESSLNLNHQTEWELHVFLWIVIGNSYDVTKKCSYSQAEYNQQQFVIKDGTSVSVFSDILMKYNPSNLASVSYLVVGRKPGGSYWLITLIVCVCVCVREMALNPPWRLYSYTTIQHKTDVRMLHLFYFCLWKKCQ